MYIYQVERDLLEKTIARYARYVSGKVLDVGSGPVKRYAGYFKKADQYMTLDINPDDKPDIIGNAEAIPVDENSFDGIVCTQVLGDILFPNKVIKEFYRVLKPGGVVLLTEGFMNELHGEPRDYWRFTPYSLRTLLEENRFKVVSLEMIGGIFSVSIQMFTRFVINVFDLYNHQVWGKIFSKLFFIAGKSAIMLDKMIKNKAGKKFGLDIIVVALKL